VDEQELPDGAEPSGPPAGGATAPLPPAETGQRPGRGDAARRALTSRAAGWVVAAVLAGVIIGLLVGLARPSPTIAVAGPVRQFTFGPAGLPPGAAVVGPFGPARHVTVFCSGGARLHAVIIGGGQPGWSFAIGPPGEGPLRQLVPPGPVRVYPPSVPPIISWEYVRGLPVKLPAGMRVQLPMLHCRPGVMAGVPVQVPAPPGQPTSQATP
jgi:hypothetical protein